MGWDINYGNMTKADCVKELLGSMRRSNWEVLGHKSTTQGAYFAVKTPEGAEFVYVAIIEKSGKFFAVKTMNEGMGPRIVDCPLNLLDLVKGEGSYSTLWRESVREHHKRLKASRETIKQIKAGVTVTLYNNQYTVLEVLPSKIVMVKDGQRYKIGRSQFKSLSIVSA